MILAEDVCVITPDSVIIAGDSVINGQVSKHPQNCDFMFAAVTIIIC